MKTLKIFAGFLLGGAILTALWVLADPTFLSKPSATTAPSSVAVSTSTPGSVSGQINAPTPKTPPTTPKKTPPPSAAPSPYSLAAIAKHNTAADCWSIINGNVYDLTSWIDQHPGGRGYILGICGTDGSSAFNAQHGGRGRIQGILQTYFVAKSTS